MEAKVEQAANEMNRLKAPHQQSDQRSGASRHLEVRSKAVVAAQNRDQKIAKSDPGASRASRQIPGYLLSVLSVAVATGVTLLLGDYTFRTPFFFVAILVSTWFGGRGPGLFAVLLSTLSINFFILEPRFAFLFGYRDLLHLAVFLFCALVISSWSTARRRAEHALQRARNQLEQKVQDRTAELSRANEELQTEIIERTSAEE